MAREASAEQVARVDRRWFLAALAVFVATVAGMLAAVFVYRITGPHPQVTLFVRHVKRYANQLLRQRLRRR